MIPPLLCCQCTIACLVSYTAVSQQNSLPVKITPRVHVSDVSYSVMHTMLPDCQPFVLKHNGSWMLQSVPSRELLLRGFAVNINIYLQRALGILMGGLSSLLHLWNKITWCAAVPIYAMPASYISFLKNNNYLWGSSLATLKNRIWFLFNRTFINCYTPWIHFLLLNSCKSTLCLSLWSAFCWW